MKKLPKISTAQACGAEVASPAESPSTEAPAKPPIHRQIKLALDVHAADLMVVPMVDGAKPQPPQRMTAEQFLECVAKQKVQAKEVISCYESETAGLVG